MKKIKKDIIKELQESEIGVNCIKIRGYNKEDGSIKTITISLNDISNGNNILYKIKSVLDTIENKYNLCIIQRLVEF